MLYNPDRVKYFDKVFHAYHDGLITLNIGKVILKSGGFLSVQNAFGLAERSFYPILAEMVRRRLDLKLIFPSLQDKVTKGTIKYIPSVVQACERQPYNKALSHTQSGLRSGRYPVFLAPVSWRSKDFW